MKKIDTLVESSKNLNEEINGLLEKHEERRGDIESEYGAIKILSDRYFDLADQENRTNAENELLKSYAQVGKIPELRIN